MSETIEPDKKTYEELLAEIDKIKNKCDELTKENNKLISKINNLRDIQGYEICEFFFDCNSLKITAEKYYFKILTNKCAICLKKSTMITGDCKYCNCHYCNIHRLPESHCCIGLDKCKSDSFQDNYAKTISGKFSISVLLL